MFSQFRKVTSKYGFVGFLVVFIPRQEEMLVCACLIFARQGTPLTVPMFAEVARNLAANKKKNISRATSFRDKSLSLLQMMKR